MEKQDVMYGIAAVIIIVVIALVIKPVLTGQSVNTGLPLPATTQPTIPATMPGLTPVTVIPSATAQPVKTPTPTPVVTWDKTVKNIVFVNPAQYGISMNQSLPRGTRINETQTDTTMMTFATISGQYSGTSQIINVPFPYWELWYTVDPSSITGGKGQKLDIRTVEGSKQSGEKGSGSLSNIQGSYSVVMPQFTLQVMDGNDPNRIVRTITPPGGIDKDLWSGTQSVTGDYSGTTTIPDPRPWKEKFFEGERNYFFIITTQSLNSYTLEFKVPTRYV
jgi:hypothetical protein